MGIANSRTQAEIDELMRQLSSLPKASTNASPEDIKKINDKWKHKSTVRVRNNGRINRTKGK